MRRLLPAEEYDNDFKGQSLRTTYFDTWDFKLRKTRLEKEKYCTIRIRSYAPTEKPGGSYAAAGCYAISAKTEEEKYREELESSVAETLIRRGLPDGYAPLPGHLRARLMEITDGDPVVPVVTVSFTRYAVEDNVDRITLDCAIATSGGKEFPTNILENKTTAKPAKPLAELLDLGYA